VCVCTELNTDYIRGASFSIITYINCPPFSVCVACAMHSTSDLNVLVCCVQVLVCWLHSVVYMLSVSMV
jgi:hypothetical protein